MYEIRSQLQSFKLTKSRACPHTLFSYTTGIQTYSCSTTFSAYHLSYHHLKAKDAIQIPHSIKQQLHSLDIITKSAVTIYTKTCLLVMRNSVLTLSLFILSTSWIYSLEITMNDKNILLVSSWQFAGKFYIHYRY